MAANTHSLDLEAGSSQYAEAADSASLSITGNLTQECWVKFESTPASGDAMDFMSKYASSQQSWRFLLFNNSGTPQITFNFSSDGSNQESKFVNWTPSTGVWYHVAVTFTAAASEVRFYVNGTQQGTTQTGTFTSLFNSTAVFRIGNNALANAFFDGLIDDCRVWNAVRTEAEIAANRSIQLTGGESNLQAYWQLNNGYLDETANNNDLTASGSPTFSTDVPFTEAVAEDTGYVYLM